MYLSVLQIGRRRVDGDVGCPNVQPKVTSVKRVSLAIINVHAEHVIIGVIFNCVLFQLFYMYTILIY